MEHGNLIEQGTHNELLAKGGVYKELVLKQQIQTSNDNNRNTTQAEEDEYDQVLLRNEAIEVNRKSCIELQRASEPLTIASMPITSRKSKLLDGHEEKLQREKKDKHDRKKQKAPIWRIIKQMRPHWPLMMLGTVGAALAGGVFPLYALFFAKVITLLNENDDKKYGPLEGPNFYSFLFVILGLVAFLGFSLQVVCFEIAGSRYTKKLRSMLFAAFLKQEIGYFDQDENSVGSLTSKLAVDAKNVNEMITRVWPDIIQILFTSTIGTLSC
jgi:ABC-type multidrug transport system fused ATPase/permease subunit